MRKLIIALICFVYIFGFTGCYDAREIGSYSFVISVGIDYGINDKWRITFQIPDFGSDGGQSSGQSGSGAVQYKVITIEAPSFFAGVNVANTNIPRRLNFEHVHVFAFSEDIAKNGDLGEMITPLVRFWEVRRSTNFIICRGSALEFITGIQPFIGGTVSKTIQDLVGESDDTGLFPKTSLGDLYDGLKSLYKQPIAIYGAVNPGGKLAKSGERYQGGFTKTGDYYAGDVPRNGGNKIEFVGCIIADGDKEVGNLTGLETRFLLMLNGRFKRGIFSIPDPEMKQYVVPMELRMQEKPEMSAQIIGGKVYINIKVKLNANIMAVQSRINYEEPQKLKELEQDTSKALKAEMDKLIKKCQELNSDCLGLERAVVRCFMWKTVDEWEQFNWLRHFSKAQINTELEVKIRHTGTLVSSSPILTTRGKE